jgi:hypothetical protein
MRRPVLCCIVGTVRAVRAVPLLDIVSPEDGAEGMGRYRNRIREITRELPCCAG